MINDLVTVAIASYNNSIYLERCIQSVLNQTYSNIEILVVDDGSSDNTREILNKYNNIPKIKIVYKENGGLSSTRQMALDLAKGVYISFIDADDYINNAYVERLLNHLDKENADICVCSTYFISESGNNLENLTRSYSFKNSLDTKIIKDDELRASYYLLLCRYFMCDSWNKMYRMSFLRKTKTVFKLPKGLNGTDLAFNHKILLHNPIIAVEPSVEYYHVIYKASAVHRKNKQLQKSVQIFISQIIDECVILHKKEQMLDQIKSVYIASMRDVFQDVYDEFNHDKKKLKNHFILLLNEHEVFSNSHEMDVYCNLPTKSLKIFSAILQSKSLIFLKLYFKYRGNKVVK